MLGHQLKKIKSAKNETSPQGFTLVELLVASAILIVALSGILMSYIRCIELTEISRNSSMAVQAAMGRMEQIKSTAFAQIKTNYNGIPFTIANLNGRGVSYVDDTDPDLLEVTVSVSWQQKNGRVFGEDSNLNGAINGGEDLNVNGMLDSPVQLVNSIVNR